jgi:2-dehydro-3-deoxyglucarate aldolase
MLIRNKLESGNATVGSWMQLCSPSVAEVMGKAGFDWVAVDLEHGEFSLSDLPCIFRAIELGGTLPFARLAEVTPTHIKRVLDAGARGLIFPMIESEEQLRDAIRWSYYPPRGSRGVGYSRANLFGKQFDEYLAGTGADLFLVAQIEAIAGIDNLDAILKVEGLDAIIMGPYDLSASMGITGQFHHADFVAAMETAEAKVKQAGIPMGQHVVQPDRDELSKRIAEGYQFIAYGIDAVFLCNACVCP